MTSLDFRGTQILVLKHIKLWKSLNPVPKFKVFATLLGLVVSIISINVGLSALQHVGSLIILVSPCVSIVSRNHAESIWFIMFIFISPIT